MCTSYSTAETNTNNNQQEELRMIDFNTFNILMTTSEISSHPQKIGKGSTQWVLTLLGQALIYTTEEINSCL